MANKMADKKKNASQSPARSQDKMVAPGARSDEKEPGKAVKAVARERTERKGQESKTTMKAVPRRESKSPAPWQVRMRNNRSVRFIFDAYYELRHKVTWPSFNEARNMTIAVILISAAVGLVLGAVDLGLYQVFILISHLGGQ